MTIQFANIQWNENQPYSLDFNDVYFNSDNGLQETEYVFIAHNQLKQRFAAAENSHFTIIETGFGTGLNFLAVAAQWLALAPLSARLHYISIEKFPLNPADFFYAVHVWPKVPSISKEMTTQYDNLKVGLNTFNLADGRIQLDLHIGDVAEQLPRIKQIADAWLLDGFAPAKNAEMWSNEVFAHIARLSKTNTTFATFTSAGAVRRGLQAVGFHMEKHAGFGKKREMLSGVFV
jgi:tRNA 5-methylaminomethyl-2-thiouridine biosynthesis bifunctional protein